MRPVNLLPQLKYKKPVDPLFIRLRNITIIFVGVLLLAYGAGWGYKFWRQSHLNKVEAEITELQPVADRHNQMMALLAEVQALNAHLTKYGQAPLGDSIRMIAEVLPAEIKITNLTMNGDQLSFTTQGGTLPQIGLLYHNLEQSPNFADPKLGAIGSAGNGRYNVTITVTRKGGAANGTQP